MQLTDNWRIRDLATGMLHDRFLKWGYQRYLCCDDERAEFSILNGNEWKSNSLDRVLDSPHMDDGMRVIWLLLKYLEGVQTVFFSRKEL